MINPGPIVKTALKIIELLTAGDPKDRARALRARAENLRTEAHRLLTAIRAQELSAHSGSNSKFHNKQLRRMTRKSHRLNGRAVWWDNRADRIDPP